MRICANVGDGGAEKAQDRLGDSPGGLAQAAMRHPQHAAALELKASVALAVGLEAGPGSVKLETVELDDQSLSRPEHVDLQAGDPDVDLWGRDSGALAHLEEPALELRLDRRLRTRVGGDCAREPSQPTMPSPAR